MGRTSTVIQPRSTPGQVLAISTASSMVSVSRTEYPPRASLVSMNGPSVTPPTRTVLAVAGGASWCPLSTSLPEPPPPFSYQAPIWAYQAWPSASVMFLATSVSSSRMTYFTVASRFLRSVSAGPPHGRPCITSTNGAPSIPTAPGKDSGVPPGGGQPRLHGEHALVAPLDIGAVGGLGHRALARPVDHFSLFEQHPALALAGGLGHDPGQRVEQADHHGRLAEARLPDLLEGALHQPVVGGLGRDDPDEPAVVPVHPGRMPLDHDLAEALAEPVDTGQGREGVVDRGGQGAQRDLHQLVDAERHVLAEGPVRADDVRPAQRLADVRGRLRRPDRGEPVSAHHEVARPMLQVDHGVRLGSQPDQALVPDELHVPADRGEQHGAPLLGLAHQLSRGRAGLRV